MSGLKCRCDEFDSECIYCIRRERLNKIKNDNPQPFYVVVYGISRYYGGPEEGGWWDDIQRVLDVKKVWTIKKAIKIIHEFEEEYPTQKYNRFSVLGNGEDIEIVVIPTLDFIYEKLTINRYE